MSVDQFFIQPIKSDDTLAANAAGIGKYTLASGTTYYIPLSTPLERLASIHFQWDAAIILTSVTLEVGNMPGDQLQQTKWTSTAAGDFVPQAPATGINGVTCSSGGAIASGVVSTAGGTAGAALFNLVDYATCRARLKVVVAGTGGVVRVSGCHKGV